MSETGPSVRRIRRLALLGGIVAGLSLLLALKGAGDANRLVGASDREEARTVSDVVLQALVQDAQVRRDQRSDSDPSYTKRVDAELNEERINVLFYGYGESHEPPLNERVIIGSVTIASIDTRDTRLNDVALVSLTHDIRAPEIERYLRKKGDYDGYPVKIDKAYPVGGFALMRKTLEDATGLAIDFQVAFADAVIARLVDEVIAPIEVEVPADFEANPFYIDGMKFPARRFSRGTQSMDGVTVIQYIKTVPSVEGGGYYGRELEHNARKHLVFRALGSALEDRDGGPGLILAILRVLIEGERDGLLSFDFEAEELLIGHIGLVPGMAQAALGNQRTTLPQISHAIYIVDSAHGDGGVQWVTASESPMIKSELALGRYPDQAVEVPLNPNPYGDLVTEYWGSVRSLVKKSLLARP